MDRLVLRAVAGRSVVRHELSVKPVHISQGLHCQCGIPDPQGVSPFLLIERGGPKAPFDPSAPDQRR